MKYNNIENILKTEGKKRDQNLVALDRIPHQVLAKLSSFGFVLAEKELIIIYITRDFFYENNINKSA